jgi:hypothetical protein
MRSLFYASLCLVLFSCGKHSSNKDPDPATGVAVTGAGDHTGHTDTGADAQDADSADGKIHSANNLYIVKIGWTHDPVAGTLDNSAIVHFDDLNGQHVAAVLKSFHLYHQTMGPGSIKDDAMTFTQLNEAHWQVDNVYFSMPGSAGSWVVNIEAEVNGQVDKAQVPVAMEVK